MPRATAFALILAACSGGGGTTTPDARPSADAGPGAPLALETVKDGFEAPVWVGSPPGDARLFVVEQSGRVKIIDGGVTLAAPFLDIHDEVTYPGGSGESGLLGLAFHPDYATNGRFYVNLTNLAGDTRVREYVVSADPNLADESTLKDLVSIDQPYANHNGGNLVFGPDGRLWIGMGDGGSGGDPDGNGQNPATLLAKMLRLDVDTAGSTPEIWGLGVRNPWRWSFDRQTGDLYVGDVGQDDWEEIDVRPAGSPAGQNFGWNVMEGTHCFPPGTTGCDQTGKILPVVEYSHAEGCTVVGGYAYRGTRLANHQGRYFYADYCSGWIRSFRWDGAGGITEATDYPDLGGGPISSFGEDRDGELYVVRYGGTIQRLVPAP